MALVNSGDAGKYSNLQKGVDYMNKNSNTAIDAMNVEQSVKDSLKSANNNTNGFMVMSGVVFDTISKRVANLQSLITAIGSATDPKAIADLNARINTENLLINNEMVKIQAMQIMQQAKLEQMRNATTQKNIIVPQK